MIRYFKGVALCLVFLGSGVLLIADDRPKSYPVLSGVGIALREEGGGVYVGKVLPGAPAHESGLISDGAQLVSVETGGVLTLLDGKSVGETASLIRGPVGTDLFLNVKNPNLSNVVRVRLTRAPIELSGLADSNYQRFIKKPMPALSLFSLEGNQAILVSDYVGKIVVLDFWASWCATCYQPVAKLQALSSQHPEWNGRVELIAVTIDSDLSRARRVIARKGWNKTSHHSVKTKAFREIGLSVIPLVIIIAPEGTIASMSGAHAIDVEDEVEALLAK
jgi:thiol-disulfide isomerase/thioredoxin